MAFTSAAVHGVDEGVPIQDVHSRLEIGSPSLNLKGERRVRSRVQPLFEQVIGDSLKSAALVGGFLLELTQHTIVDIESGACHTSKCIGNTSRCQRAIVIASPRRLPPCANCQPQPYAEPSADADHRENAAREVRVDGERHAEEQNREALLFLSVDEEHEPDPARDERDEEPGRVDGHPIDDTSAARE